MDGKLHGRKLQTLEQHPRARAAAESGLLEARTPLKPPPPSLLRGLGLNQNLSGQIVLDQLHHSVKCCDLGVVACGAELSLESRNSFFQLSDFSLHVCRLCVGAIAAGPFLPIGIRIQVHPCRCCGSCGEVTLEEAISMGKFWDCPGISKKGSSDTLAAFEGADLRADMGGVAPEDRRSLVPVHPGRLGGCHYLILTLLQGS